jgi:hypothetical protein
MVNKKSLSSGILILGLVLISWMGMIIHNRVELPMMSLLRVEYLIPTAIYIIMLCGWLYQPAYQRLWTWLLFSWVIIHFVIGAWLSVLPLSIWPFLPEQSSRHYLSHVIYGLLQVPLLWHLSARLRSDRKLNRTRQG